MLYYLAKRHHLATVQANTPKIWKRTFYPWFRPLSYETFLSKRKILKGTYIFTDQDRLTSEEAARAVEIWGHLVQAGKGVRLLNHPTRTRTRYDLLRLLYKKNLNTFNLYRLDEHCLPKCFPVFLRDENVHGTKGMSMLLRNEDELRSAIEQIETDGKVRTGKLIVEFCDTRGEDGHFRKYSAYFIGDEVVPRHMFSGTDWKMSRSASIGRSPSEEEEEWRYLEENPHANMIREIFALARIEYGRIDYSFHKGKMQVWEINTNPTLLCPMRSWPVREGVDRWVADRYVHAMKKLDVPNVKPCWIRSAAPRSFSLAIRDMEKKFLALTPGRCEDFIRSKHVKRNPLWEKSPKRIELKDGS